MGDFYELALRRQSCRRFTGAPVAHEKLLRIIEAGRLAPSACNSQPWSFVVAQSPEAVHGVAKAGQQLDINSFLDQAGAFIVVLEEHAVLMPKLRSLLDSQYFARADLGVAVSYMCLEAESLGLGTCQIGIFDREILCSQLNIPLSKRIVALIAVGYAADDTVRPKKRKPLEEIARFV